jgi:hypothetical protein
MKYEAARYPIPFLSDPACFNSYGGVAIQLYFVNPSRHIEHLGDRGAFHRFDELCFSFREPENAIFHFSTIFLIAPSAFRLVAFFRLILSIQAFSRREPDVELALPKLRQ